MTPELVGVLSVGAALAGLNVAIAAWLRADIRSLRAETRAETHNLRTELRAEIHDLRTEVRADIHALRSELRADIHALRTEVRADIRDLRADVHGLDQRTSRIEGVIEGVFAGLNGRGRSAPPAGEEGAA